MCEGVGMFLWNTVIVSVKAGTLSSVTPPLGHSNWRKSSTSWSTSASSSGGKRTKPHRQLLITAWYTRGAFFSPNGIRTHWKCPNGHTKAEISFARSVIRIAQKPLAISRLMNHIALSKPISRSSIRGSG
ncbi:hypothetical protein PF007_g29876 [Phytophthora fragariae]|uniref:FLYWCH-type domain-containing protein n=1 Tax=Phytophthora fragariae TaxID=53985 RepID=A0A6A3PKK1_9STRA|nr:hypothetical protein PF007_g29876 [Phytophthora fragariae]